MLVGYDYSSGEENDYLPDDSVIIEKPKPVLAEKPKITKSIIGISAPKLKASSLRDPPVEPNAKKPKLFSSSSKLQDLLPKPIHDTPTVSDKKERAKQSDESGDGEESEKEESDDQEEEKIPSKMNIEKTQQKEEILVPNQISQEVKEQPATKPAQHFKLPPKQSKVQQSILQQIQQQKIQQQQQQQVQQLVNPALAQVQQQYNHHQQYMQQQQLLQQQKLLQQNPQYQQQLQQQQYYQQQLMQQQQQQQPQPQPQEQLMQQQKPEDVTPGLGEEQGPQGRPPVESYEEYYEQVDESAMERKNRWGEMRGMHSSEQVLEIRAGDIHNGQFSRTELAHKSRLEKMSVNINKQMSNRRGQLSVIAMEAERQSLMDEERREAQKAMRKETKNKYGW
jgi:hypothetical protein